MRKYIPEEEAQIIVELSGSIFDFDSYEKVEEIMNAIPKEDYVLKPNREGGGSNFFGEQAYEKLISIKDNKEELQQYILMKKIKSTVLSNGFIANFNHKWVNKATSEVSTFGSFMYEGDAIKYN